MERGAADDPQPGPEEDVRDWIWKGLLTAVSIQLAQDLSMDLEDRSTDRMFPRVHTGFPKMLSIQQFEGDNAKCPDVNLLLIRLVFHLRREIHDGAYATRSKWNA